MSKLMIFIDGTWLYMNTPKLAESYRTHDYQIDFGKLPRVLAEELRERLPFPVELDLVRTHLFGSYAANYDLRDQESVQRRLGFFRMLREEYGYEADTFPVNFRGRRVRRTDRTPGDNFEPKEKCVDIALATTMSHFAAVPASYDIAIAVLGDADFMPMLQHVRRLGKRVAIASIKESCSDDYIDQTDGARVRDFDIIWLDDILEKLELRYERQRRECEDTQHVGDAMVWTDYRPRRGEKFFCDACRQQRNRHQLAPAVQAPAPLPVVSDAVPAVPQAPLSQNGETSPQHNGSVSRKLAEKGYGFIRTEDGSSYFFHATALKPGVDFLTLQEGTEVTFDVEVQPTVGRNGKAVNVTVNTLGKVFPAGFAPSYSKGR